MILVIDSPHFVIDSPHFVIDSPHFVINSPHFANDSILRRFQWETVFCHRGGNMQRGCKFLTMEKHRHSEALKTSP